MGQDIALWKTWGEFLEYPSCCVEAFCKEEHVRKSIFWGTGFCPCKSCHDKVEGMSYEEAVATLLKRDPNEGRTTMKQHLITVIKRVNTKRFKRISLIHGLDVESYLVALMKDVKGL